MRNIAIAVWLLVSNSILLAQQPINRLQGLEMLEGSWNVVVERRLSSADPWDSTTAVSIIRKTTGNSVMEEDFLETKNRAFSTKTIIVFNHFTGSFQRAFIDSEHGVLVDYEGQKTADKIVFNKNWIYPNKTTVKLRVIYTIVSKTEFSIEYMRMPGNSTEWNVTDRLRYVKPG